VTIPVENVARLRRAGALNRRTCPPWTAEANPTPCLDTRVGRGAPPARQLFHNRPSNHKPLYPSHLQPNPHPGATLPKRTLFLSLPMQTSRKEKKNLFLDPKPNTRKSPTAASLQPEQAGRPAGTMTTRSSRLLLTSLESEHAGRPTTGIAFRGPGRDDRNRGPGRDDRNRPPSGKR